jgi:putative SOS response-associated peptidase YedK
MPYRVCFVCPTIAPLPSNRRTQSSPATLELVNMSWGFVPPQKGRALRRATNTPNDKALSSRFWRSSFEQRRCLVPVSSFAEPKDVKPATWHWFALKGAGPRPLFAFAGLWQHYIGPVKKDGPPVEIDVYSFMTTTPNALVGTINHELMPVLFFTDEACETWINGSADQAFDLVREYSPGEMQIVQGFEKREFFCGLCTRPCSRLQPSKVCAYGYEGEFSWVTVAI